MQTTDESSNETARGIAGPAAGGKAVPVAGVVGAGAMEGEGGLLGLGEGNDANTGQIRAATGAGRPGAPAAIRASLGLLVISTSRPGAIRPPERLGARKCQNVVIWVR